MFPIETTNEPFGLKNINKPVRALGHEFRGVDQANSYLHDSIQDCKIYVST